MNKTLYLVRTNAYDFLMTDDGTTRRVLANEYAQCNTIHIDGFLAAVEDDSSWTEYSETAEELIGDGVIVAEVERDDL